MPSLIFKINFSFVCLFRSRDNNRWLIFSMLDVLFSRWVFIHLSLHESKAKVLGMPSPKMQKWIYFILSNNKFLGKCWYGGQPWIRLAMESERMVEKGINFISCLGTAYGISSMESVQNSKSFSLVGKVCLSKCFISQFSLWALAPLQIPTSLCEGPFFYFMQFLFLNLNLHPLL